MHSSGHKPHSGVLTMMLRVPDWRSDEWVWAPSRRVTAPRTFRAEHVYKRCAGASGVAPSVIQNRPRRRRTGKIAVFGSRSVGRYWRG